MSKMSREEMIEVITEAVEILSHNNWRGDLQGELQDVVSALQAEQEPVGEVCGTVGRHIIGNAFFPKGGPLPDGTKLYTAPPAQDNDYRDAYEGAREDLLIWKKRALQLERDLRKSPIQTAVPGGFISVPVDFLREYKELLKGVEYKAIHKMARINAVDALIEIANAEPDTSVSYDDYGKAIAALQAEQEAVAQICIACGKPWDGKECGQADNEHPYPVCTPGPVVTDSPPAQAAGPEDCTQAILEAGRHLERVMIEHPYCDHVQVVKSYADIRRRTLKKQTRTQLPEGVTNVRNAATGESVKTGGNGLDKGKVLDELTRPDIDTIDEGIPYYADYLKEKIERGDFDRGKTVKTVHEDLDYCAAVCAHPAVHQALVIFAEESTHDNAVGLVREILAATEVLAAMGVVPGQGEDK